MTKRRPPHVSIYRDRHGKVRWRFRKAGAAEVQTTLPFGSPEWWAWYFAAEQGERLPVGADRTGPGTFAVYACGRSTDEREDRNRQGPEDRIRNRNCLTRRSG